MKKTDRLKPFPDKCVACDTELEAGFFCPKCDSVKFYKPPPRGATGGSGDNKK